MIKINVGFHKLDDIQFTAAPSPFYSLPINVIPLNRHRCCSHLSSLCIPFNLRMKNEWNHSLDMVQIVMGHPLKKCVFSMMIGRLDKTMNTQILRWRNLFYLVLGSILMKPIAIKCQTSFGSPMSNIEIR